MPQQQQLFELQPDPAPNSGAVFFRDMCRGLGYLAGIVASFAAAMGFVYAVGWLAQRYVIFAVMLAVSAVLLTAAAAGAYARLEVARSRRDRGGS